MPRSVELVMFARAPIAGECKTRLIPALGAARAAQLSGAMLEDCVEALGALAVDQRVLAVAPGGASALAHIAARGWICIEQRGADLGERLRHVVTTRCTPERALLIVGSDAPVLPIQAVAQQLEFLTVPRRVLLGPSADGGYYLIGLSTPETGLFEAIPWSSAEVARCTRERCAALGLELRELPEAFDIDEPRDLERLRALLADAPDLAPRTAALLRRWQV